MSWTKQIIIFLFFSNFLTFDFSTGYARFTARVSSLAKSAIRVAIPSYV